ncbi:MAG TPA: hypothetical protein VG779_10460 [Actinomycetota bacterium]|nr:hypothetical protein [Actinomycetota bacterium]
MGKEAEDFEMVAASLRADSADLPTFVEALAAKLEAVGTAVIPSEGGHAIPPPSPVLSLNDR